MGLQHPKGEAFNLGHFWAIGSHRAQNERARTGQCHFLNASRELGSSEVEVTASLLGVLSSARDRPSPSATPVTSRVPAQPPLPRTAFVRLRLCKQEKNAGVGSRLPCYTPGTTGGWETVAPTGSVLSWLTPPPKHSVSSLLTRCLSENPAVIAASPQSADTPVCLHPSHLLALMT